MRHQPAPRYFADHLRGLSPVVIRDLRLHLSGAALRGFEPVRVYFDYSGPPADLLALRTTEDVLALVGRAQGLDGTRSDFIIIEEARREAALSEALATLAALREIPTDPAFRITAVREGEHDYSSHDLAAAIGAHVVAKRGWRVDLEHHDIDIRIHVCDDRAVIGLRLSCDSMARRSRVRHSPASLKPTLAHAMCLLGEPAPGEVLLDPMCGSGTILLEAVSAQPEVIILGSDRDPITLDAAAQNLAAGGIPGRLSWANACALPLPDASVDRLLCNLPWGRRVGSHRANRRLYPRFLAEAVRVLRPGGRMVLLSQERRLMRRALADAPDLSLRSATMVTVGGLRPSMYVLDRG